MYQERDCCKIQLIYMDEARVDEMPYPAYSGCFVADPFLMCWFSRKRREQNDGIKCEQIFENA